MSDEKSLSNINYYESEIDKARNGNSHSETFLRAFLRKKWNTLPMDLVLDLSVLIAKRRRRELQSESESN